MKPLTLIAAAAVALAVIFVVAEQAGAQNAAQIEHSRGGRQLPALQPVPGRFRQSGTEGPQLRRRAPAPGRHVGRGDEPHHHGRRATCATSTPTARVFTGVSFAGANMTNASFVGAYLEGANFRGANLTGVNFSGAEMDRAVGLTQGQLNQACGDESTTLPRGLRLRSCG